jgi:hypothetical protein
VRLGRVFPTVAYSFCASFRRSLSRLNKLMKRVPHSLVFSIAATTLGAAFFIVLSVGFAWLVRADIIFLK